MGKAEYEIENYLKTQVEDAGGICWKISAIHTTGIPDRIVVLGRTVFVETKSRNGRLTKIQKYRKQQIHNVGGDHFVVASKQDVDELVTSLKNQWQKETNNDNATPEDHSIYNKPLRTM